MKALLLSEYRHLELADVPEPSVSANDILIRVKACGICGSDVHGYDGSTGRRIPPIVMGHEASGVVEKTGRDVEGFREGDRVTFDSTVYCGHCFFCKRGEVNLCDHREVLGVSTPDFRRMGAFAEYVTVPQHIVYRLPDSLPFAKAAMVEAVGVAVHAVALTPVSINDTALVVGAGMIGCLVLQAARLAGCGRIIVVDIDDSRLQMAAGLGATDLVNSKTRDAVATVRELTGGRGADIALECVGTTPTVQVAIEATRKGGAVTLVGNVAPKVEIPLQSVVSRQIRLQGSAASSGEYPVCMDLLARGAIRVDSLLTATAPLEQGPSWFERLYNREPNLLKVVLEP
ncbi:MAG TPA: galactitol-1-phosphate 5-dehydrogenase [Bryobacteraceae bacterium]|nr:galactitol-1-phosphate 5-dehydrogenase [Bryobacteraceae bacterium]